VPQHGPSEYDLVEGHIPLGPNYYFQRGDPTRRSRWFFINKEKIWSNGHPNSSVRDSNLDSTVRGVYPQPGSGFSAVQRRQVGPPRSAAEDPDPHNLHLLTNWIKLSSLHHRKIGLVMMNLVIILREEFIIATSKLSRRVIGTKLPNHAVSHFSLFFQITRTIP
jgi:hypothetical protein